MKIPFSNDDGIWTIFSTDLTLEGCRFEGVGAPTENPKSNISIYSKNKKRNQDLMIEAVYVFLQE